MPVLDAKALRSDRKGLAFLRAVLRPKGAAAEQADKPAPQRPAAKDASSPSLSR